LWSSLYQYNCQCYNIELGDVYTLKHALLVACETWQIIIGHHLLFETCWISHELIFQFEKYDSLGCSFSNRSYSGNFVFFIWVFWDFENLFQWNVLTNTWFAVLRQLILCLSLSFLWGKFFTIDISTVHAEPYNI